MSPPGHGQWLCCCGGTAALRRGSARSPPCYPEREHKPIVSCVNLPAVAESVCAPARPCDGQPTRRVLGFVARTVLRRGCFLACFRDVWPSRDARASDRRRQVFRSFPLSARDRAPLSPRARLRRASMLRPPGSRLWTGWPKFSFSGRNSADWAPTSSQCSCGPWDPPSMVSEIDPAPVRDQGVVHADRRPSLSPQRGRCSPPPARASTCKPCFGYRSVSCPPVVAVGYTTVRRTGLPYLARVGWAAAATPAAVSLPLLSVRGVLGGALQSRVAVVHVS